tara:strand:- start:114 stop:788 length:675 start_codon:yes stop_codon:yes gene_type:complete
LSDLVCTFNTDIRYLGNICSKGHQYLDTGKCLRAIKGGHCIECNKERKRTPEYKAKAKTTSKNWRERQGPEYKKKEAERKRFDRANNFNEMIRGRLHKAVTKALVDGCVIDPVKPSHIRAIWNKFDYCCAYCGTNEKDLEKKLEIEHVICFKRNGPHTSSNIVPSCTECNSLKRANLFEIWYPKQTFFSKERYQKIKDHQSTAQLPPVQLDLVDIFKQSIYGVA